MKLDFLRRSTFYAFVGNNLLSSMANFLPAVYIPCEFCGVAPLGIVLEEDLAKQIRSRLSSLRS